MTRLDSLRLLLIAEIPRDLPTIEASLTEMTRRIDELDPEHPMYAAVHHRLDELLAARERALDTP